MTTREEERRKAEAERKKREAEKANKLATQRFYFLIALLAITLVLMIATIILWANTPRPVAEPTVTEESQGIFGVKSIILEGNTRYREEAVIGESGVIIGQSIFKVDAEKIEKKLIETFPYYAAVEIKTMHMDEVHIIVKETRVIGAIYSKGYWVPVGANGKALEEKPIVSDRPKGLLYIKGTKPPEGDVVIGQTAIEPSKAIIVKEIVAAIDRYGLEDIVEIDLTDPSDLTMNWRNQIVVRLGNASNITHEIGVVASTIPAILESRGQQITGVLNVSSYSNEALDNQAVFTPSSLLPAETTAARTETTTTTQTKPTKKGNN